MKGLKNIKQKLPKYSIIFLLSILLFANSAVIAVENPLSTQIIAPLISKDTLKNLQTNGQANAQSKQERAEYLMIYGWKLYQKGTVKSLDECLQIFQSARKLWQQLGNAQAEANSLLAMGRVYADLGQKQKALDFYQQMLAIARSNGDIRSQSKVLNNIGQVYEDLGEKQKALEFYNQAIELTQKNRDRSKQASISLNIGRVLSYMGEKHKALDLYNQALSLFESLKNIDGQIIAFNNLGQVYLDLQDKQTAMELYEKALSLLDRSADKRSLATTLNNVGQLNFELGKQDKAIAYFRKALQIWSTIGDRSGTAATLNHLGAVYQQQGKIPQAESQFNQALSLARKIGDRSIEANTLENIAQLQSQQGNLQASQKNLKQAIDIIEDLRSQITNQDFRISYFATRKDVYKFYIDLLMRLHHQYPQRGYNIQALEASENARARGLLELLSQAQTKIRTNVNPELLASESRIKSRLEVVKKQLQSIPDTPPSKPQITALNQEIDNLVNQYQNLQTQLRIQSPNYGQLMYPQPLKLKQIQQQLDPNTVLLEYALGRDRSYVWCITQNTFQSHQLPPQVQIQTLAEQFRTGVLVPTDTLPEAVTTAANRLSEVLIAPASQHIKNKRLVIVGDDILQQIPFAALPDPADQDQPLMVDHEIINLPSASTIAIQRLQTANRQPAPNQIAILADPVYTPTDERVTGKPAPAKVAMNIELERSALKRSSKTRSGRGFFRLPFTRTEAEAIAKLVPSSTRLKAINFDANYEFATSPDLSKFRILHFATHGFVDNDNPELSGLVLSLVNQQGQPRRGYLRLADLFNLNYPAELIVLSACDTGLGKQIRGEGLIGLSRGLMYAGAARIVISLWQVSDEGTAVLMESFYRHMFENQLTPAAALRQAQIELWNKGDYRSPFYWAGFTLQGEWS